MKLLSFCCCKNLAIWFGICYHAKRVFKTLGIFIIPLLYFLCVCNKACMNPNLQIEIVVVLCFAKIYFGRSYVLQYFSKTLRIFLINLTDFCVAVKQIFWALPYFLTYSTSIFDIATMLRNCRCQKYWKNTAKHK